jgi:hypothetical protein
VVKTKRELYPPADTPEHRQFMTAIQKIKNHQEADSWKALENNATNSLIYSVICVIFSRLSPVRFLLRFELLDGRLAGARLGGVVGGVQFPFGLHHPVLEQLGLVEIVEQRHRERYVQRHFTDFETPTAHYGPVFMT